MNPAATDKQYVDIVAKYVRNLLPYNDVDKLLRNDNIDRLYFALITLKKDVEVQLSAQKARANKHRHELNVEKDDGILWKQYQAEEADWRARATKFLSSVEAHISATKERSKRFNSNENNVFEFVRQAILEHSESIDEEQASPADKKLWNIVDR